ncbi:hypothetical protein JYU34_017981 [Plutella xylostella]|uniref:Uncharacterized protein n=1 Tax=Plutella xylostella TaxID=51655 RepID=A0ABQ7Q0U4_PLUXY|nr:hypothetical protein JYU34_017981 [Plutella xylostella]
MHPIVFSSQSRKQSPNQSVSSTSKSSTLGPAAAAQLRVRYLRVAAELRKQGTRRTFCALKQNHFTREDTRTKPSMSVGSKEAAPLAD